jgi:hypothetical protein
MKFNEIEPGKQYTKSVVDENRSCKPTINYKIYVLDVNVTEKKILASIGGAPSKWYSTAEYKNWERREQQLKEAV